jgi:prefoldin subunit 5
MVITTQTIIADAAQLQKEAEALAAQQSATSGNASAIEAIVVTVNNAAGQMRAIATRIIAQATVDPAEVQNQAQALASLASTLQASVAGLVTSAS